MIGALRTATLAALFSVLSTAPAQDIPTIEEHTSGMTRHEGFVDFYWDGEKGKLWLEVEELDTEFCNIRKAELDRFSMFRIG